MKHLATSFLSLLSFQILAVAAPATSDRPNVLLILADDMGRGDLAFFGNPKIKTPNFDKLASESTRFEYFYVSPVCSPTRASLMTGRYNFRTGVVDTALGRQSMDPNEVTIAEMLRAAGYRTGIFGKWHLGDSYPMRPIDQGFEESLVIRAGGTGQLLCPRADNDFRPVLLHNGRQTNGKKYTNDLFTDAAIRFISDHRTESFFVYVPVNTPHTPLEVPERYYHTYKQMNLGHSEFPSAGHPLEGKADQEMIARIYGMVASLDENVGRLLAKLDELKLKENTIVIFLSDNGANQAQIDPKTGLYQDATNRRPINARYNCGMLDLKGSVYEGGIRVPFFLRWPAKLKAGRNIEHVAAHIDVAPTLLEACGVTKPAQVKFDGLSLVPLLKDEQATWPDRNLYFQWHRGDTPQIYRAFAVRSGRYKLVQANGADGLAMSMPQPFKLFDMTGDPLELKNLADDHPDIVETMRGAYERWFKDVTSGRDYSEPSRIHIGAPEVDPTILTWHDSRGDAIGQHFDIEADEAGSYRIALRYPATSTSGVAHFAVQTVHVTQKVKAGTTRCVFPKPIHLEAGRTRLEVGVDQSGKTGRVECIEIVRTK
jgi:arylsulfatase A-like enzyme